MILRLRFNSLFAGFLAALAGLLGKVSLNIESTVIMYFSSFCLNQCEMVNYTVRVSLFLTMFLCNGIMMIFFLRALECGHTLTVTVLTTSVNFILSGVFGKLIFSENLSFQWILGIGILCIGILCILSASGGSDNINVVHGQNINNSGQQELRSKVYGGD